MTPGDLRFCPICAAALVWQDAGHPPSRQPVCTACGFVLWQNMKPSVEALIVRGTGADTEVLLGRRGDLGADAGIWDIPGGFLNADDRVQEALHRECLREVGVNVAIGDVLGAFDADFAGTHIVSIMYVCTIASGEPRAADIVDAVAWFRLGETPPVAYTAVTEALALLAARVRV